MILPKTVTLAALGCTVLVIAHAGGATALGIRARGTHSVAGGAIDGYASADEDADTLDDGFEDALAERFAPVVFHGERESSFPTTVDAWLARTHLNVIDGSTETRRVQSGPLRQAQLIGHRMVIGAVILSSSGVRSRGKRLSFALENVPRDGRDAVPRPHEWVTYVHTYPNEMSGVTLQYWRAYTRNDATWLGLDLGHGGDWEAIAVHLDDKQQVRKVTYLGHSGIVDVTSVVKWDHSHPLVWSEEGGHSSNADAGQMRSTRWFRQETWTSGGVSRWDSMSLGTSGGLRNIGEKTHPRNDQLFVQYSGLWGAVDRLFMTSGYWGPAFNETDATCDDGRSAYRPYFPRRAERAHCGRIFLRAWCDGMDGRRLNLQLQCYASGDVP